MSLIYSNNLKRFVWLLMLYIKKYLLTNF